MTTDHNLDKIELKLKNRAYLSFQGDGIIDILVGWMLTGIGLFLYTHSYLTLLFGLTPIFFFKQLKVFITLPRQGHAKFRPKRTPSMWVTGSMGVILLFVAFIYGFILKGFVGPMVAIFGIAFLMILNSGFNRIFFYALLVPLFFIAGLELKFLSPTITIAAGATVILYGIWMLVKFIQNNPILDEGMTDVSK